MIGLIIFILMLPFLSVLLWAADMPKLASLFTAMTMLAGFLLLG